MNGMMKRFFVYILGPLCTLFSTWIGITTLFPAFEKSNGVAIIVGGLVLAVSDLVYRFIHSNGSASAMLLPQDEVPDIWAIPYWASGIVMISGRVSILLSGN